jgi:hypothetical protein
MPERTVALVAAHFPPSNLAGVHRARLLSQHLQEFGWRPIVVTTHWKHYEEALDWGLAALVDPSLEVIRVGAIPTRPVRLVGDLGIRAFPWHLAALTRLRKARRFDFLHIIVASFYSAMLGECLYRRQPLPFGIDYMDPWVHSWPPAEVRFSKAWLSMRLAERLEPIAVRHATMISGVAEGYYNGVFDRNPGLRETCASAAMPMGFSNLDFAAPEIAARAPSQFDPSDGNLHLVYAGALLPKASGVLDRALEGLKILRERGSALGRRARIHFIGTGSNPNDPKSFNVAPVAAKWGLADVVTEHPHRMSYLDVLVHLRQAHGILILGSNEPHYTPSKVFQAVQSRRPVLAFLHEASTAVTVLEASHAGLAIRLGDRDLPDASIVADILRRFLATPHDADRVDWEAFEAFSARESARRMAAAFDEAMVLWDRKTRRQG